MNKLRIFLLYISLSFACFSYAIESPKEILNKVASNFTKGQAVSIDFLLHEGEKNAKGNIIIKGEKYFLSVESIKIWFDGKTMWTYVLNNEEVNITSPTEEEIKKSSPFSFLYMYNEGYDLKMGVSKGDYNEIIMTRTLSSRAFSKIIIRINKRTYDPMFIQIENQNTIMSISDMTITRKKLVDSEFKFNENLYPNIDLIDLR
jgi:outer membrane lipoprotein-sorting protein